MTLFLSGACFVCAMALTLDAAFLSGTLCRALPDFTATATAAVGLAIAALEHRARTGKKQREWPMAWMLLNAIAAIAAAALWAWRLFGALVG